MKKKKLKNRMNRVFLLSLSVPFFLILIVHGLFIENLIFDDYSRNIQLTLQSMSNHLNSYMESYENFFLQYLFENDLQNFFYYVNNHEVTLENKQSYYTYFRRERRYRNSVIKYMSAINAYMDGITFVPEDENKDSAFYLKRTASVVEQLAVEETGYQTILSQLKDAPLSRIVITKDHIGEDQETDTFTMGRRINQIERAQRQGYLFLEISTDIFGEMLGDFDLDRGAGVVITYPDERIAYSTSGKTQKIYINNITEINENTDRFCEDRKWYRIYSIHTGNEFGIDYIIPENTILNRVWKIYGMFTLAWLAAGCGSFLLYSRLVQRVEKATNEIITLTENYQIVKPGTLEIYSPESGIVEFDKIGMTITEMMKRIQHYVEEEYILKLNQQAAEYKAMQTEINPHFFNNVLSSFVALNRLNDRKKLEKAILGMSRLFRYTCEHGYESTIGQECRFIDSYLMLEKIRFEDRLDYKIEVDEEVQGIYVPKLLLQPLVENAMKHGFTDENRMVIEINATMIYEMDKKYVWMKIANDGIPMKKESVHQGNGVGIQNVRERLKSSYRDSFLWYSSSEKFPTICNVLICL